jgi:hypothetical protein
MQLQVFGDSAMTIKWMNNEIQVHGTGLSQLLLHLKDISGLFQTINFTHIYRELNNFSISLSKDALHMDEGLLVLDEFIEGHLVFSRPCDILDL